jgi:hypothetical protein
MMTMRVGTAKSPVENEIRLRVGTSMQTDLGIGSSV